MGDYDYKPNSNKYKAEQRERKKVEKVVSGVVGTKKKNELSKFANNIFAEDLNHIKESIRDDVIIPSIKDILWSVFTNSIDMLIYGNSRGSRRPGGDYNMPMRNHYDYAGRSARPIDRRDERPRSDFDDITFRSRGDAEVVLSRMRGMLRDYPAVSVGDMYDLAGETPPHTAYNWGWISLDDAYVAHSRGVYIIKTPRPIELD